MQESERASCAKRGRQGHHRTSHSGGHGKTEITTGRSRESGTGPSTSGSPRGQRYHSALQTESSGPTSSSTAMGNDGATWARTTRVGPLGDRRAQHDTERIRAFPRWWLTVSQPRRGVCETWTPTLHHFEELRTSERCCGRRTHTRDHAGADSVHAHAYTLCSNNNLYFG